MSSSCLRTESSFSVVHKQINQKILCVCACLCRNDIADVLIMQSNRVLNIHTACSYCIYSMHCTLTPHWIPQQNSQYIHVCYEYCIYVFQDTTRYWTVKTSSNLTCLGMWDKQDGFRFSWKVYKLDKDCLINGGYFEISFFYRSASRRGSVLCFAVYFEVRQDFGNVVKLRWVSFGRTEFRQTTRFPSGSTQA